MRSMCVKKGHNSTLTMYVCVGGRSLEDTILKDFVVFSHLSVYTTIQKTHKDM